LLSPDSISFFHPGHADGGGHGPDALERRAAAEAEPDCGSASSGSSPSAGEDRCGAGEDRIPQQAEPTDPPGTWKNEIESGLSDVLAEYQSSFDDWCISPAPRRLTGAGVPRSPSIEGGAGGVQAEEEGAPDLRVEEDRQWAQDLEALEDLLWATDRQQLAADLESTWALQ
jgi:hypothetical protein